MNEPSKLTILKRLLRKQATKERNKAAIEARMRPYVEREEREWDAFIAQYQQEEHAKQK